MKKKLPFLLLLLSYNLYSQSYSELLNTGLENKSLGSIATGDLNNDGYLDLITTGIDESSALSTSVYINDKDGSFSKLNVGITAMYNATIALGDYNEDGFLDVLIAGEGYDPMSALWKNNGDLTFTEVDAGLADLGGTNAEFRDIDNDGDLDILIAGPIRNENGSYSNDVRLYSNEGNDSFSELELSFSVYASVGTLGDFDNDGDLDLLTGGGGVEIYPNNGDGTFSSPLYYGPFPAGQMKWFDYNNDGNLDFIISGRGNAADDYFTKIFQNVGVENNWFAELQDTDLTNPRRGKLDLRDYNSDGNLDLLITGTLDFSTNSFVTKVYDNSGTDFSENTSINIPQLGSGDACWLDLDNDGDLDLILTGEEVQGANVKKTVVYRNDANDNLYVSNSIPVAPLELSWVWTENNVALSWAHGSDEETSTSELSYNIGIGYDEEASDILFPESNIDGSRLIYKLGNAQSKTEKIITNLEDGIFYFKVQSIDGALQGSEFSAAEKFAIGLPLAPTEPLATIEDNGDISFTWTDNSVNEFSFVIEQKSNLAPEYVESGSVATDESSFIISGLEDAIYTFRIKAVNPNGESEYIETSEIAVGEPAVPSEASGSNGTDGNVSVSWIDNSVNEFSFVIEQKSNLALEYVESGSVMTDESSFTISGLEDAIYTFRIKAVNPNGESEYVETSEIAVGEPAAPSEASGSNGTDGNVSVAWIDNSVNEFSFVIEQKSNLAPEYAESGSATTDESSFIISGLEDAIYTFRIKAVNPNGESDFAETNDVAVGIPVGPSNFSASVSDRDILLSWEDLDNERTYKLERSSDNGSTYEELATLEMDVNEYLDESLLSGVYTYRIQAVNENGESDFVNSDISIEIVLGMGILNQMGFNVYPNPVSENVLYIKTLNHYQSFDVQITDIGGKILDLPVDHSDDAWRINFAGIQAGIYLLKVQNGEKSISQRIIIE